MRRLALVVVAVAAALSTGCFQSETVIRVKADGTGTIEQTNLANKEMLGMAAGMARQAVQQSGADASKAPSLDNIGDLFDEAKIREQASSFGLGVRYVSSAPLTENGLTGVKATFAFDDVRLLNMNNSQGAATPTPQLRFEMVPAEAGGSTLRIRLPEGRPASADAAPEAPPIAQRPELPPEALAMVRSMFKGAKINVAVEVDGAIVTTDGPKRDGSRDEGPEGHQPHQHRPRHARVKRSHRGTKSSSDRVPSRHHQDLVLEMVRGQELFEVAP